MADGIYKDLRPDRRRPEAKQEFLNKLLDALGFECRIRGDHYIYTYAGCLDIINIQPNKGMAKPYQIKQIRNFIAKYKIKL